VSITVALNIAQLVLAVVLIIVVLLQAKGSGFMGMFGGDSSSVYRTKRGLELRLFQFTVVLAVLFFLIALINSLVAV
jgi:preprotein translocase subunit SecG